MSVSPPSLSIVLLMYNEEGNIAAVLDETLAFGRAALGDFEILVVDDGGTDGGADIVSGYAAKEPRVRLVSHDRNRGMGAGMRTGIRNASKTWLVFNAADGQVAAAEIGKLLPLLMNADIVLSTYENRRETWTRELVSRAFRLYLRAVAGIRFELQGLYLYPTAVARELEPLIAADTFFFSFELIERGIERGLTTATTEMTCRPRTKGASKIFNPRRIVRVGREAARYGLAKKMGSRPAT
ncbi:MAG: glycosyltransferase family 2 protein [Deltaproteobacteria bacterium]|nr:glycosyltransferase family 2 protein [Deltaproteobacteria bacterium]